MRSARKAGFAVRALAVTLLLRTLYSVLGAVFIRISLAHDAALAATNFTWSMYTEADGWRYLLLGPWQRYDALWYSHIAAAGYDSAVSTVFYPLYPLLMTCFGFLLPPLAAGLLISTVASFFFFWGFQKLADVEWGEKAATWGLLLICVWPASFVLFGAYAEALLLTLMVWSVWFGHQGKWRLAGIIGLLAGLTKATGFLVVIPLLFFAWRKARHWKAAPVLLPLIAYPGYQLWLRLAGFAAAPAVYRQYWHTEIAFPWTTLMDALRQFGESRNMKLVLGASLVSILLAIAGSFLLRREYAVFCWGVIAFFLIKHTDPILQSSVRYCMVAFPAFAAAGTRTHLLVVPLASLFLILNVAGFFLFVHWGLII